MPGGDGTGPLGRGPMTGRRVGYCTDTDIPEYENTIPVDLRGRGRGLCIGRGRFLGRSLLRRIGTMAVNEIFSYNHNVSKEDKKKVLTEQIKEIEEVLINIKERLNKIERGD